MDLIMKENLVLISDALECGLDAVMNQGWTRGKAKEITLIQEALGLVERLRRPKPDDVEARR